MTIYIIRRQWEWEGFDDYINARLSWDEAMKVVERLREDDRAKHVEGWIPPFQYVITEIHGVA